MSSIFSKIVAGEIPAYSVAEDDRYLAFLDIRPLMRGHTLAIPKQEVDYIFDLDDDLLGGLMAFSKRVGKAIEQVVDCSRIGIAVVGLEVPHAHVHLMPINSVKDMSFSRKPIEMTPGEMEDLAARIRDHL